uniref:Uncharacterized protein n=1 Tax=Rhizophora mucronata TaxID=61149 RepID=A0A2P2PB45_RHIMU
MLLVLRIAILCTAKLPKYRPSMRDVIAMLGEAKPRRKSICHHDPFTMWENINCQAKLILCLRQKHQKEQSLIHSLHQESC